jgi:eukaryotic-like serine/threonine-protein kinase
MSLGEPAAVELASGTMIAGKYRVERRLGGGGMGSVYKAHQVALAKDVAIKVMHPALSSDATFVARFNREARAASRLAHANSIAVMDFGAEPDGQLYLVMEYVHGVDLEHLIKESGGLSDARTVSILSQVLAAVSVAHDLGIVHRDLKPENVMVLAGTDDEGHDVDIVKVCDFGIASLANDGRAAASSMAPPALPGTEGAELEQFFGTLTAHETAAATTQSPQIAKLTQVGAIMGTPAYMSPEQCLGVATDARSDLYSLGVILYECITGQLPFESADVFVIMNMHIASKPREPSRLRPGVNAALAKVCMTAMAKDPAERFASARQFRTELRRAVDRSPSAVFAASRGTGDADSLASAARAPTLQASTTSANTLHERAETVRVSARDTAGTAASDTGSRRRGLALASVAAIVVAGVAVGVVRKSQVLAPSASAPPSSSIMLAATATTAAPDVSALSIDSAGRLRVTAAYSAGPVVSSVGPRSANSAPPTANALLGSATQPTSAKASDPEPSATAAVTAAVATTAAAVTEPIATAAAAVTAPAQPIAYETARARLSVTTAVNLNKSAVQGFVNRISIDACYQKSLRSIARSEGGSGVIQLHIAEDGVIASANVTLPAALGTARTCIASQFQGQRLPQAPDPGDGDVTIAIALQAP